MNTQLRLTALAIASALAANAGYASAAARKELLFVDVSGVQAANQKILAATGAQGGAVQSKDAPSSSGSQSKPMTHTRHEGALGLDAQSRLVLLKRESSNGNRTYRYQQTFYGMPVLGDHVLVRENADGSIDKLYGSKVSGLASEVAPGAPRLSQARALEIAKTSSLGFMRSYMRTNDEKAQLAVYIDNSGRAYKAYDISFFATGNRAGIAPKAPRVVVDANTGRVLEISSNLRHAIVNATGPGGNGWSGQYNYGAGTWGFLTVDLASGATQCTMNNGKVKTSDMGGASVTFTQIKNKAAYSFTCLSAPYVSPGKTVSGAFSLVNDAHYFGTQVWDMYPAYTGRNIAGGVISLGVNTGSGYNAYADGGGTTRATDFGNGDSTMYPTGTLDGVGHEMSHIYTGENGRMTYKNGSYATQGGSMDEAFSDMAEEAANFYVRGNNDFIFWNDSSRNASAYVRNLCNPGSGQYTHISQWTGRDEYAHPGSTIYSKPFCVLAKTAGWDTKKAFQVFADANANAWTPTTNFNTGACGVEDAAVARGYRKADVTAAFAVTGVACPNGGGGGSTVALVSGTPVALPAGTKGTFSSTVYTLAVPAGKTGTFVLSGGSGDADMYVNLGSAYTTVANAAVSTATRCIRWTTGTETCTFTPTTTGTFYVTVHAYTAYSGVSLKGTISP